MRSGGQAVNPRLIDVPTLVIIPEKDTIVPPASASPLIDLLPRAEMLSLNAGHIGMIAGSKAKTLLYKPLCRLDLCGAIDLLHCSVKLEEKDELAYIFSD